MRSRGDEGYALVALVLAVTLLLIAMSAAIPAWRYVMKNEREEELLFRGGQIADAIKRYQARTGSALPTSMDVLVKGKFLRKAYKDPLDTEGKWRLVRQGEPCPSLARPPRGSPAPGGSPAPDASPPSDLPGLSKGGPAGARPSFEFGPFHGVVSTNGDKSLRVFNGQESYSSWCFIAGQPRIIGKLPRGTQRLFPGQGGLSGQGPQQSPPPTSPPR